MTIQSILAVTDFSAQGEQALDRAALVAVEHRAQLRVMYFTETPNLNFIDPFARLAQRARQLARRHGIAVEAVSRIAGAVDDVADEASHADLLVLDDRRQRRLRSFWRGTAVDEVMRRSRCPVLIVRREPRRRYARVLVAVDFSAESKALVRYACNFDGESELELFHSIHTLNESRLRSADVSPEVVESYRNELRRHAQDRLFRLTDSLDTRRNRVMSVIGHGDPARQAAIQQDAIAADLVVVGKNRHSMFIDFLFGSIARRLLNWVESDILVVPHDHRASSRAAANLRIQAELGDGRSAFSVVRRRAL